MADSTPPAPDSGDAPFDLDFDIGDIEFDEPAAPEAASEPTENALSRDLESLLGTPASAQENLPKTQPEPAEALIPAPTPVPTAEPVAALSIEDEFDIEDDLDDEIEPPEPEAKLPEAKAKLPEPKTELPEPKTELPEPKTELPEAVVPAPEPTPDDLDEITADLEEDDSLSAAALAAAARRKQRRQAKVSADHGSDEDNELDAILEDEDEVISAQPAKASFVPRAAGPVLPTPAPIDDLEDEFTVDLEDELPPAKALPPKVETLTDDLEDELTVDPEDELPSPKADAVTDELEDELTVDLEEELPPVKAIASTVNAANDELEDELTVDLEDELPSPKAAVAADELVELEDELTVDLEDELAAPEAPVGADELEELEDELDVELTDELPPVKALAPEIEELEAVSPDPSDELATETVAEEPAPKEGKPAEVSDFEADEMQAAPEPGAEDAGAGKKIGSNLRSLRLYEWAGIAAVLFACLFALFMLAGVVRATISDAQEGSSNIRKAIPREAGGSLVTASGLEAYWRDRTEADRAKEGHVILPVVKATSIEGSGILQFLFRDGRGDIRGDGHSFKIEGGRVIDLGNGQEVSTDGSVGAFATEGMLTEVQYASYRDEWDDIAPERWSIEVRESSDGKEWQPIVQFEIPAERR